MPDEGCRFETTPPSWSQRARLGELAAVLSHTGSERKNLFHHHVHLTAARIAAGMSPRDGTVLDFGCGTGRFLRYFRSRGRAVLGTEITREMLEETQRFGLPDGAAVVLTDGVRLPLHDESVDMVWCCGVLRYSLFVDRPAYRDIAGEMYRVLRPGGKVVNVEMYVDSLPEVFASDFEQVGFATTHARVLHRYGGRLETLARSLGLPMGSFSALAALCAGFRLCLDNPYTSRRWGLRDYLFVWHKGLSGAACPNRRFPYSGEGERH